jgi:DNA helicase-2/ATP-dependent DNA helicase PcrA
LSELERIEIIRNIIEQLPAASPLSNFNDFYYYEPHLTSLFKIMKTESWSIEDINTAINQYIVSLPTRSEYIYQTGKTKGQLKDKNIAEEVARMEKLRAAANLYDVYQEALRQKKRYDFDDMILWVIDAFAKNENLLRNYQEQYMYFLVDEYQDTNGAQNKILRQLITFWDLPNVFIVGDDDQAIYEFQGARLQSLKDLYATYEKDISIVVLKENYRSTQGILDKSRILVENNQNRIVNDLKTLGLNKHLLASNPKLKKSKTIPEIIEYPNSLHEYADVANKIVRLIEKGEQADEIAVIYAKNKQATTLMQLMDKMSIPYTTKRPINVLKERIVQQMLLLLRFLEAESKEPFSGESYLYQVLHFQCWQISSHELAQLSLFIRKKNNELESPLYWRQIITQSDFLAEAGITENNTFLQASRILEKLIDEVNRIPLAKLYELALNLSGILKTVMESEDVVNELQMLHTMFSFIQSETEKQADFTLSNLITMLSMMERHRLSLPMQKTISAEKGVLLTTAHSSKGLEFKYVFMIDCNSDSWEESGKNNRLNFKLPDNLTLTQGELSGIEARRRLFYVAMTRAKQFLYISYAHSEKLQRAIFIDELIEQADLKVTKKSLPLEEVTTAGKLLLESKNAGLSMQNHAYIEERLADFALSPSSLNRFLDCPLSFYYEHLLKVPTTGSEALIYGRVMHSTLESFSRKYKKERKMPSVEVLLQLFEKYIYQERYHFSAERLVQRLERGKQSLSGFYKTVIQKWNISADVEVNFRQTTIDNIPVQGVIDRIEYLEDGSVEIIDFKTGAFKNGHVMKLSDNKPEGGNYRRQLLFYKLMYENHLLGNHRVHQMHLSYLEPDITGDFTVKSFSFDDAEIQLFKNLLHSTYHKIKNQEFYEGCGKSTCHWCTFNKYHVVPESFANRDIEDLDDTAV